MKELKNKMPWPETRTKARGIGEADGGSEEGFVYKVELRPFDRVVSPVTPGEGSGEELYR